MVDLVRGNLRHLAGQSPAGSTAWPMNGVLQGGATDLDDSDAVIWRAGLRQVRAALGAINRSFEFRIGAYMTAGTGTLRAEVSTTWARGIGRTATASTAANAIVSVTSTAPTEVTLTVDATDVYRMCQFGSSPDDGRAACRYFAVYLRLLGIVNAGGNFIRLKSIDPYEVEPS